MHLDFEKGGGLLPAIVQDARTQAVLMLGYMDAEAWAQTQASGLVTFFSRSKGRLWTKGESSGHYLRLQSWAVDCDADTLLLQALPAGPVCHTGAPTCFGAPQGNGLGFLQHLEQVIAQRQTEPAADSYTSSLFAKGINKVAQKVGEEAVELVIEAKDDNEALFLGEAADLLFHYLVLLRAKGHGLQDVLRVLEARHG